MDDYSIPRSILYNKLKARKEAESPIENERINLLQQRSDLEGRIKQLLQEKHTLFAKLKELLSENRGTKRDLESPVNDKPMKQAKVME